MGIAIASPTQFSKDIGRDCLPEMLEGAIANMNTNNARAIAQVAIFAILLLTRISAAAESTVTLVDAGAEPRSVLAFKCAKDTNQLSRLNLKSSKSQKDNSGQAMEMVMPTLAMELGGEVTAVEEDGDIKIQEILHRAKVIQEEGADPRLVQMFSENYAKLVGMKSETMLHPNGTREMTVPADNPLGGGGVGDVTTSFAVTFPSEALGAGAKWEVASQIDQQGIQLSMKYLYEIVSLEADKLSLKVVISGSAPAREISLPNMPPNSKAELISTSLSGSGTADMDLSRPLPVKASQTISNDSVIKVTQGEQSMELSQSIKMDQQLEDIQELSPKDEAPAKSATKSGTESEPSATAKPKAAAKPRAGKKPKAGQK